MDDLGTLLFVLVLGMFLGVFFTSLVVDVFGTHVTDDALDETCKLLMDNEQAVFFERLLYGSKMECYVQKDVVDLDDGLVLIYPEGKPQ